MKATSKKNTFLFLKKHIQTSKTGKKSLVFVFDKRQKFVISVGLLAFGLFLAEFQYGRSGIIIPLLLALFTDLLFYWAVKEDLQERSAYSVFIMPTFYSLAFGLFYFLVPASIFVRAFTTGLYAFGLYSLFLSQNIFIVGAVRTIALLSGARIVSFVITLLAFFFLTNITFTLHIGTLPTLLIMFLFSYPIIFQSLWTYALQEKVSGTLFLWSFALTLCIIEAAAVLWFWPSSPTVIALFLAGFFYTVVGLSHVWLERRLFRGVLWEYVWVGAAVFFVLLLFTPWGK